jgi:hypothetical protein
MTLKPNAYFISHHLVLSLRVCESIPLLYLHAFLTWAHRPLPVYHQVSLSEVPYYTPKRISVFCMGPERTVIISLYIINWLVLATETGCVYWAVRNECLKLRLIFRLKSAKALSYIPYETSQCYKHCILPTGYIYIYIYIHSYIWVYYNFRII